MDSFTPNDKGASSNPLENVNNTKDDSLEVSNDITADNSQEINLDKDGKESFSFDSLKPKIKPIYKVLFAILLVVCIGISLYFSFNAVSLDTYEYSENNTGYTMDAMHNPGNVTDFKIDYVYEYKDKVWQINTDKIITEIKSFALCCDETIETIYIGENILNIQDEAFYSCKNLKAVIVDENNPNYSFQNGILFNKDKTEIILFPSNYINYEYNELVKTSGEDVRISYVIPDSVKKVAPLCFAYTEGLVQVDLNNVEILETMAFFKCETLKKVLSNDVLTKIGSDAFSYCYALEYFYIPKSIKQIDHHAFYEDSKLEYLAIECSKEDFKNVITGDYWHNVDVTKTTELKYEQTKKEGY